ncbi:MAG: CoA-acylating methylmalonate-semialdehyde dehydrogenase [Acidobacteriota bacterium]|nr:CoA-acylating methylmalonate-semialdehyde dehydrogenase [Acidobacteriota bacterium]
MNAPIALENYIDGVWSRERRASELPVSDPARGKVLARVPLSGVREVDKAAESAAKAFAGWRRTPAGDRIQPLFKLKNLLDQNIDDLARTITAECGKTYAESVGELRRGIENIETACGIPLMMQGYNSEDIARGIDEAMVRQPLGVVAAITPFNFPGMIPLWFLPYAVACGNAFILKPSEKVPMTAAKLFRLIGEAGFPPGVLNLVHGAKETVDAILDHPLIRAVSFVGSTPVARYVYSRAAENGKRAQCQGGAKNPVVVMPDADAQTARQVISDSAFGCAGQRCLAASMVLTVGDARKGFTKVLSEAASGRVVGYGLDEGVQTGPVISPESKSRIEGLIDKAVKEGSRLLVDGRGARVPRYEKGNFIRPTVLDEVDPRGMLAQTEVFGPVLSLSHFGTLDDAIEYLNRSAYGNMACLFTQSGAAARKFKYEAVAGNIGINLGVAAPMAYFPFTGWKGSFYGDLHAQGRDAVDFYTDKKVVIERWPKEWSRKF